MFHFFLYVQYSAPLTSASFVDYENYSEPVSIVPHGYLPQSHPSYSYEYTSSHHYQYSHHFPAQGYHYSNNPTTIFNNNNNNNVPSSASDDSLICKNFSNYGSEISPTGQIEQSSETLFKNIESCSTPEKSISSNTSVTSCNQTTIVTNATSEHVRDLENICQIASETKGKNNIRKYKI